MFAGLLVREDAPPPESWVAAESWIGTLYPRAQPDISGHFISDRSLLVSGERFNTPWSHALNATPMVCDELVVGFWGRLDNREGLAAELSHRKPLARTTDHELVLLGWRAWGADLPMRLRGDFALAVLDTEANRLFLARDPAGIKPLYYWSHPKGFLFATSVAALRRLKHVRPTPDTGWMARYLVGLSPDLQETAFEEILKLPPGHALQIGEGRETLGRYHRWRDDVPEIFVRDPARVTEYRTLLERTIAGQMESDYPLGIESSGGIDSSTILAFAARQFGGAGERLHALSIDTTEREAEYILEANVAAGIEHSLVMTTNSPEFRREPERIRASLDALGYPYEHANAINHTPFYAYCEANGIRTLLSGFGGDEAVTNYGWGVVEELWLKGQYRQAFAMMPSGLAVRAKRSLALMLGRDRSANELRQPRLQSRFQSRVRFLRSDIAAEFTQADGAWRAMFEEEKYASHNDGIINGFLARPWGAARLENCTLLAASYGVEYRWPLWDAALVQFYLSTPVVERLGDGGWSRFLHRRAIAGLVPDKVAWKPDKDMGRVRQGTDLEASVVAAELKAAVHFMPPRLDSLIDRAALHKAIARLESRTADPSLLRAAQRAVRHIRQLGIWLQD